jgi:hypothetical protein
METIFYFLSLLISGSSLEALADDDFQVREQATHLLTDHWLLSWPLLRTGEHSLDPEVRRRCRQALLPCRRFQVSWTTSCLLIWGDQPWITIQEATPLLEDHLIFQELVRICRQRNLLSPRDRYDDSSQGGRWGFLCVMRYRYRGLPDPP